MSQSLIQNMQSNSFHMNREIYRNKNEGTDGDTDLRMPTCRGIDIEDLSIVQLQQYLANGSFSIRALTSCYLERITRLNPLLRLVGVSFTRAVTVLGIFSLTPDNRAVIEVNPDALDIADELDKERTMGQVRSPLHGIPFLVKDVCIHLSALTDILLFYLERISIDFYRDCIGNAEYSY